MKAGAARPLLLPGNMCDGRLWTPALRALFDGALDADLSRDDTIERMAAGALALVSGPVLPIGFSMGAIVAMEMARQAPDRIAALVLLDTNPAADMPERAAHRPAQQAAVMTGELERIVVEELKPAYLAAASRTDRALLALLRDMAMTLGPEVFVRQSEALRTRADLRPLLPALTMPVFVGCGAEDALCPPAWHAALAAAVMRPTYHVFPDAGHMLPLEQPLALREMLGAWIEDIS